MSFNRLVNAEQRLKIQQEIIALPLDGSYTIEIKKYRKDRSGEQNRFYHAVVGEIAKVAGYSPAQMKHEITQFLNPKEEYTTKSGEKRTRVLGTSELTVEQMTDLLEKVLGLAEGYYNMKVKMPIEYGYDWEIRRMKATKADIEVEKNG